MSIRTRALVFSTFFGSCIAIGLLLASLTTNHWVRANLRRGNSTDSRGEINYGLFYGNKYLNSGFGVRINPVYVYTLFTTEPQSMSFWLWLITALGTGFGLLGCAVAAIASVLKAASAPKKSGAMMLLLVSNISSAVAQVIAFVCWLIQFYQYLQHQVLALDDHKLHWYSHGLAYLGYSFYMVIASTLVVFLNISVLIYARSCEKRDERRMHPASDDKTQSAIMLY